MSLKIRTTMLGATLLAVAAATATPSLAQEKPKSDKRIPISKEAAGEVVRVDTVLKTDTVTNTVYRTDTLMRTMVRVDTVQLQPPPVPIHLPAGFYAGGGFGTSMPEGSMYTPNSMGYMGQIHLGWQNTKQAFGGRISTTYTGLGHDSFFSPTTHGRLWTLSTDAKLNLPLGHIFGLTPRLNAYGIGGWTYSWYRDMPYRLNTGDNLFVVQGPVDSWTGKNGWDAGGGLSLFWNRSEVFVESRVMGFTPTDGRHGYQAPFVVGFNWY